MACLDTCVIVDLLRRDRTSAFRRAKTLLQKLVAAGENLSVTRFTYAELCVGVERSRDRGAERTAIEVALSDLEMLEFDEPAARLFGKITAHLQETGRPVGDMDVLIASVAMVNGHSILTRNSQHFTLIPELKVVAY